MQRRASSPKSHLIGRAGIAAVLLAGVLAPIAAVLDASPGRRVESDDFATARWRRRSTASPARPAAPRPTPRPALRGTSIRATPGLRNRPMRQTPRTAPGTRPPAMERTASCSRATTRMAGRRRPPTTVSRVLRSPSPTCPSRPVPAAAPTGWRPTRAGWWAHRDPSTGTAAAATRPPSRRSPCRG